MKRITDIKDMVAGRWYHVTPKQRMAPHRCGIYQLVAVARFERRVNIKQTWFDFDSFYSIFEIEVENG